MSFDRFIELLQQLITMTDPEVKERVWYAENILDNLLRLADESGMADLRTVSAMKLASANFTRFLRNKEDFAGRPGDYSGNQAKRRRLAMMLRPSC